MKRILTTLSPKKRPEYLLKKKVNVDETTGKFLIIEHKQ